VDKFGNIYELTNTTNTTLDDLSQQREDVARLDGYLRARAEHDHVAHKQVEQEQVELRRLRDEREKRDRRRAR
jgi:hypothetical protein